MKVLKYCFLVFIVVIYFFSCTEKAPGNGPWPEEKKENQPWTRWWWMGNAVDSQNIALLLATYADAGFGGVEITPIYGAAGYEDKYLKFLSPEWMEMLEYAVKTAVDHNMGVDMNMGTGWPFGGPQIAYPEAASRLLVQTWETEPGIPFTKKIVADDPRQVEAGAKPEVLIAHYADGRRKDLTNLVEPDGTLHWMPDSSQCTLIGGFCGKTLQKVKRAAPGGEGLVMDHFSKSAFDRYIARFDSAFSGSNRGVRCFFNDSYEAYGTDWTPGFLIEFEKRRGYRLQKWFPEFIDRNDSSETARRIRYDYRLTISELLLENFTQTWTGWSHEKQALTRNQAHGSPGNLLDLYAAVDIPECETFGSSYFPIPGLRRDSADVRNVDPDPVMMKFASSAAHITGKKLVSCESFTWLAEHFKVSLSQCKPELDQVFLSGVNHVFYHGTSYSPVSAGWPGWLFYASVNFAPSNSFWPHLKGLNRYVTRCQSILQSGVPDNNLLVYWPLPDTWMTSDHLSLQLAIHDIDRWLHPSAFYKLVTRLGKAGYGFDFVSDNLLKNLRIKDKKLATPSGSEYRAVLFPATNFMPASTLEVAVKLAERGAVVIFEKMPDDVPGFGSLNILREQLTNIRESISFREISPGILSAKTGKGEIMQSQDVSSLLMQKGILPESIAATGLRFVRRKTTGAIWYFLVNHTPATVDEFISPGITGRNGYLLDPLNGFTGLAEQKSGEGNPQFRIQLRSGESVFLCVSDRNWELKPWKYPDYSVEPIHIEGPWKIRFLNGGPVIPGDLEMDTPEPWTTSGESELLSFSGSAVYSSTLTLSGKIAPEYILDLGNVHESARVTVNGEEGGIVWSIPYTLRVKGLIKEGVNTIEIEVSNLMANRISWMDKRKEAWRKYHEINFVNINYRPFDASQWIPLPSGLDGSVTLRAVP
jgi:hypothetical protein